MGELARVAEIVKTIPEIVECHRITGEDCFIAKVFVEEVEDLERRYRPADSLRAHQHLDHPVIASAGSCRNMRERHRALTVIRCQALFM